MSAFQSAKWWLVHALGLGKDALHIYVALTLFLGSALLLRWPVGSWKPLAVVAIAAVAGEAWDLINTTIAGRRLLWWGSWHDVWNTLF